MHHSLLLEIQAHILLKKAASQKSQAIHSTYLTGVFLGILINFFFSPEYKELSVQLKVLIYCKDHPLSPSPTQHCSFETETTGQKLYVLWIILARRAFIWPPLFRSAGQIFFFFVTQSLVDYFRLSFLRGEKSKGKKTKSPFSSSF